MDIGVPMTSPFPDELISAYLDGELTAEERARVEEQLDKDPTLRQMYNDLRTLGSTLQALPLADPSEDLAQRVLRQAERRMLTGEEACAPFAQTPCEGTAATVSHTTESQNTDAQDTDAAVVRISAARRHWRLIAGITCTVAALLLVTVMLFDQTRPMATNKVAMDTEVATPGQAGAVDTTADDTTAESAGDDVETQYMASAGVAADESDIGLNRGKVAPGSHPAVKLVEPEGMKRRAPADNSDSYTDNQLSSSDKETNRDSDSAAPAAPADVASWHAKKTKAQRKQVMAADGSTPRTAEHANGIESRIHRGYSAPGQARLEELDKQDPGRPGSDLKQNAGVNSYGLSGGLSDMPAPSAGSARLGLGASGVDSRKNTDGQDYTKDSMQNQHSLAITAPATDSPATDSPAALTRAARSKTAARKVTQLEAAETRAPKAAAMSGQVADGHLRTERQAPTARQLARQLDRDRYLLVEVSIPRDLQERLGNSSNKEFGKAINLQQATKELLNVKEPVNLAFKTSFGQDKQRIEDQLKKHLSNVVLVEGSPDAVRQSLEHLVRRDDITVRAISHATRSEPNGVSGSAVKQEPDGYAYEYPDSRSRHSGQQRIAASQSKPAPKTAAPHKPGIPPPAPNAGGTTARPTHSVVNILFRFKTQPAATPIAVPNRRE